MSGIVAFYILIILKTEVVTTAEVIWYEILKCIASREQPPDPDDAVLIAIVLVVVG